MAKHMETRDYYEQTIGGLKTEFVLLHGPGNADADGVDEVWIRFGEPMFRVVPTDYDTRIRLDQMDAVIASLVEIRKLMWNFDQPDLPPGTEISVEAVSPSMKEEDDDLPF